MASWSRKLARKKKLWRLCLAEICEFVQCEQELEKKEEVSIGFKIDGKNLLCRRTRISFRISYVKEDVEKNGWSKCLYISPVAWSYFQAEWCKLFAYSIHFSYSVHCRNSVAKTLHFPASLCRYLVLATLAPGRLSKLRVIVLRLPGLRTLALESWAAILLGRTMSTNTSEWIHPALLCAGFTALVPLSQALGTQAPAPCLHNILRGCGSADTLKTMPLTRKDGLKWNKEKWKSAAGTKPLFIVEWKNGLSWRGP